MILPHLLTLFCILTPPPSVVGIIDEVYQARIRDFVYVCVMNVRLLGCFIGMNKSKVQTVDTARLLKHFLMDL